MIEEDSTARRSLGQVRRHPVVRGMLSLTGIQAVQLVLPLLTLPYLTRVLGPVGWGEVAAALALGNLAASLPEYGFSVSASRALARLHGQEEAAAGVVSSVVSAKALLAVAAVVVVLAVQAVSGAALAHGGLVAGACLIAAGHGLWMAWYFEGVERAGTFFRVVFASRFAYVVLLFALVRVPPDAPLVPVLYGLSGFLAAALALRLMPLRRTTRRDVRAVLREGFSGFVQRVLVMTYASGNVFWLSLMASPAEAGGYGIAEQSVRAACLALIPVSRALYPRYSRVAAGAQVEPWMRYTPGAMAGTGAVLSLAVFALAGVVPLIFGADYAPYAGVVRLLSPLPLLVALSQYWTVQRLMARGRDQTVAWLFGVGAGVDLGLALLLVPRYGAAGMALALLAAEVAVALGSALLARRFSAR